MSQRAQHADIERNCWQMVRKHGLAEWILDHFQSNAEYAIIGRIHQRAKNTVGHILINPAAFYAHQCCYTRRTARGGHPVYRDPPE